MEKFFNGKKIVITGASSGIGQSMSKILMDFGAEVFMLARRMEKMEDFINEVSGQGKLIPIQADVSDLESIEKAFEEISKNGKIDGIIANAGVGYSGSIYKLKASKLGQMIDVNFKGVVFTLKAGLPHFNENGGFFAAVSSIASFKGLPGSHVYSATKAAVNTFNESIRLELEPKGINVVTLCPGFIETEMTAKNDFKMPYIVGSEEGSTKLLKAIAKSKRKYSFPWQLRTALGLLQTLPEGIYQNVGTWMQKKK